jgi:hypothetical protein
MTVSWINAWLSLRSRLPFYTDSFMNESVSCYRRLYVSVTFVDHVQTDHSRNPILGVGAHLYTWHQVAQSEFRQHSHNCYFIDEVGLGKKSEITEAAFRPMAPNKTRAYSFRQLPTGDEHCHIRHVSKVTAIMNWWADQWELRGDR